MKTQQGFYQHHHHQVRHPNYLDTFTPKSNQMGITGGEFYIHNNQKKSQHQKSNSVISTKDEGPNPKYTLLQKQVEDLSKHTHVLQW